MTWSKPVYQNGYQNTLVYFRYFQNMYYIKDIKDTKFQKKTE